MDGSVQLCNMNRGPGDVKVLKGPHSKRVFHVAFSPKEENILASGSDDQTIVIWNSST